MSRTLVADAAAALVSLRPACREMITFYAEVFCLQEEARPQVSLDPLRLGPSAVKERLDDLRPALPPPEMEFDAAVARRLCAAICRLAAERDSPLAAAARILEGSVEDPAPLCRLLLDGKEEELRRAASRLGTPPEPLSFFLLHSLRPSLMRNAAQAAALFPPNLSWTRGACPVCGSPPLLSWIEPDGRRSLVCRFCGHRWGARRCCCPFCGTDDPRRLFFHQSEEEPEYRLHFCDGCRAWWKEVDGRLLTRPAYPALEQIASLHLDLLAAHRVFHP